MRSTGIVRAVDQLGRVVIPKELRKVLDLDVVEVFTEGETIILRKYVPGCIFCGDVSGLQVRAGKKVCGSCLEELRKGVMG